MRKRSEGIFARAGGAPLAAVLALLAPAFAGAAPRRSRAGVQRAAAGRRELVHRRR